MHTRPLQIVFWLILCLVFIGPARSQVKEPVAIGTGFIVAPGYVVTAYHAIKDKRQVLAGLSPKRLHEAQIIKVDKKSDLALLKTKVEGQPLRITPWKEIPIGLEVFAIGFPQPSLQGLSRKITQGIVNGDRTESGDNGFFQLSAEIQKGNSGGPVLAPDGSVIGMVLAKLNALSVAERTKDLPQNVNYAIKSSTLLAFLQESGVPFALNSLDLNASPRAYEVYRQTADSVVVVIGRNK